MNGESLSLGLAFVAGLVSFVSPCSLPLIPTYVTYLTGSSYDELTSGRMSGELRTRLLMNAVAFVLGFSVIFIALGLTASTLGQFLRSNMNVIRQVSGIVVVAFGLNMMGFLKIPFLQREVRATLSPRRVSLGNSFVIGATFSAGWTPCVGPVLSSILVMASQGNTAGSGGILLGAYSLGMGIPFLITALGLGSISRHLPKIYPYLGKIHFASGVLMVIIGLMIYFNTFVYLNNLFNFNQSIGL